MKNTNTNNYENLLDKLNKVEDLAEEEFQKEIQKLSNYLTSKENSLLEIYQTIIDWKHNHLQTLKSIYNFAVNNVLYRRLQFRNEDLCQFIIDYWKIHRVFGLSEKEILDIQREAINYIKYKKLYEASIKMIDLINNDYNYNLKLPKIENFEIDTFKLFRLEIENSNKILKENKTEFREFLDKISEAKNKVGELKSENEDLKMKIRSSENLNNNLRDYAKRYEPFYVNQFNDLYWGDNYPALKVFYDFLLKNKIVDFSWSYFANYMSKGNKELFNLNFKWISYNKNDIGYLLYKLSDFIKDGNFRKPGNYKVWVSTKFYVNDKELNKAFTDKYIRGFDTETKGLNNKVEIDILYKNIKKRFI